MEGLWVVRALLGGLLVREGDKYQLALWQKVWTYVLTVPLEEERGRVGRVED